MKRIVLLTVEELIGKFYKEQFLRFFAGRVEITEYYLADRVPEQLETADLYIMSFPDITVQVNHLLPEDADILYIKRTFYKEKTKVLEKLGSDDQIEILDFGQPFTIDTMGILNELGFREHGVTVIESRAAAKSEFVIELDWYCISIETLIQICDKLDLYSKEIGERLYRYSAEIELANAGLVDIILRYWQMQGQWDAAMDMIDDGVIIFDKANRVIYHNEKITGAHLQADFWAQVHQAVQIVEDYEVAVAGHRYLLTKRPFSAFREAESSLVILKETKLIERLETNIRMNNAARGFAAKYTFSDIIGSSPQLRRCLVYGKKVAATEASVLITGESGTGKELFAQSLHNASPRRDMPFVAINCATLPSELLESELFGYEEGAFTGAKRGGKKGLFELAHRGTIFLDEVSEIPLSLQAKLLRVLQEREVFKIGSSRVIPIDVRIIASSNENFAELIEKRQFRKDLYYRLNAFQIHLPPLRERGADVLELLTSFLGSSATTLEESVKKRLGDYTWPGNIRELRNCAEHMLLFGDGGFDETTLPDSISKAVCEDGRRDQTESAGLVDWMNHTDALTTAQFPGLLAEESRLVETILSHTAARKLGRRRLHQLLLEQGYVVSEYKLRKLMDYIKQNRLG